MMVKSGLEFYHFWANNNRFKSFTFSPLILAILGGVCRDVQKLKRLETGLLSDATQMSSDFTKYEKKSCFQIHLSTEYAFNIRNTKYFRLKNAWTWYSTAIKFHELQKKTISLTYLFKITALWVRKVRISYQQYEIFPLYKQSL